jgi:hypothetical protein
MIFDRRWLEDDFWHPMMEIGRWGYFRLLFALFFFGVIPLLNKANANDVNFVNEVLLPADQGNALDPASISATDDGGFILTGSMNFKGWSVKVDAKGKILWRYDLGPEIDHSHVQGVKIQGAIPMQDGGTYLFASMPRAVGSKAPNTLMVHVNADGKELSRRFLSSPSVGEVEGIYLNEDARCVRWLDGFAYVAYVSFVANERKSTRVGNRIVFPLDKKFYWVAFFDSHGDVRWEKRLPSATVGTTRLGPLRIVEGNLIFSATDNTNTDIASADKDGQFAFHSNISGSYNLIESTSASNGIQLFGYQDSKVTLVSMDSALRETGRSLSDLKDFVGQGYRLGDGSYLMVGSRIHTTGETYTTALANLNAAFQVSNIKDFPHSEAPTFLDGGRVADTVRTAVPGRFVVVRKLTKISDGKGTGLSPIFQGAVIDFVKTN